MAMKIECLKMGAFETCCYVVQQGSAVLVLDPAGRSPGIVSVQQGRQVSAIVLTHGHFDHIGGADELAALYHCPIYLHPADKPLLKQPELNTLAGYTARVSTPTLPLKEGRMNVGGMEMQVMEAPGHTPGSVLICIGQDCFCGDVIFAGSIGRTDLPLGSQSEMKQTLKRIQALDPDLRLYPGHGPQTTLGQELRTNPFLTRKY